MASNQLFQMETIIVLFLNVHYKSLCQTTFPTILSVTMLCILNAVVLWVVIIEISQLSPSTVYKRWDLGWIAPRWYDYRRNRTA